MKDHHIHYGGVGTDIIVLLTDGTELKLEDITDVILSDTGHVLSFKNYFNEEVMTINFNKVKYWFPE